MILVTQYTPELATEHPIDICVNPSSGWFRAEYPNVYFECKTMDELKQHIEQYHSRFNHTILLEVIELRKLEISKLNEQDEGK